MTVTRRVVKNLRKRGVVVYSRRQWGSQHIGIYQWRRVFRPHKLLPTRPADTFVQHITVTQDSGEYPKDFKKDMRTVEYIGWTRFGSGVSYNFVVDMITGEVGLGQALDAKGTHTLNNKNVPGYSFDQNAVALAVSFLGMPGDVPSQKAKRAVAELFAVLIEEKALTADPDYVPHSMFAYKDCPTDAVRSAMPQIKRAAKRLVKA